MTQAEIWQIVIGIVSAVSSFVLSLIIFIRQIIIDKKVKKQDIENKVTNFIIENKEEIHLLPLCIISNEIHKTDKHTHKIYSAFNKLEKCIQEAILLHEDVNSFIVGNEAINNSIDKFEQLQEKYEMGKNMLYEGAKYFHKSYDIHKNEKIEDIDPHVFQTPYPTFFPEINTTLHTYIDNYLLHKINPNDKLIIKVQEQYFIPPMDLLYEGFNFGACEEKVLCFWLMRYIISTCYVLNNRELIATIDDNKMPILEEFNLTTYEDFYYYTIYMLIKTFSIE